jgi:hypothetical protein
MTINEKTHMVFRTSYTGDGASEKAHADVDEFEKQGITAIVRYKFHPPHGEIYEVWVVKADLKPLGEYGGYKKTSSKPKKVAKQLAEGIYKSRKSLSTKPVSVIEDMLGKRKR